MLMHLAARNETIAIDYRETAPAAMTRDVFLDEKGEADPKKSRNSALGVGVPGTVAGLALAHERYGSGKFTFAQLIAPAIGLAREGFAVEDDLADSLPRAQPRLARWPSSRGSFSRATARRSRAATRWCRANLRPRSRRSRHGGPRAFYDGPLAEKIVAAVQGERRHHDAATT